MRFALSRIVTALLLLGTAAAAQEGTYVGSGEGGELTVEVEHIDADIFSIDIGVVVPADGNFPGCGGEISGETNLTEAGGNFFVENEEYDPQSDSPMFRELHCEIALSWDEEGILTIEEKYGCLIYHGAACSFTGQLVLESAAN